MFGVCSKKIPQVSFALGVNVTERLLHASKSPSQAGSWSQWLDAPPQAHRHFQNRSSGFVSFPCFWERGLPQSRDKKATKATDHAATTATVTTATATSNPQNPCRVVCYFSGLHSQQEVPAIAERKGNGHSARHRVRPRRLPPSPTKASLAFLSPTWRHSDLRGRCGWGLSCRHPAPRMFRHNP